MFHTFYGITNLHNFLNIFKRVYSLQAKQEQMFTVHIWVYELPKCNKYCLDSEAQRSLGSY